MTVNLSMLAGAGAQFFDDTGVPLTGGKLYTYAAGTTTPQATYTTNAGSVAHTNPIVLNSAGRVASGGEIWLTDAIAYKFVLETSTSVTIATYDNITGNGNGIYAALAAPSGSSLIGYLSAGTGAVATTVQSKLRETVSVKDFGATGDGVTDDTAALQSCFNYAAGVATVYIPAGTYMVDAVTNQTGQNRGGPFIPSNSHIVMDVSTVIKAIPNASDSYNVLLINNATNVIVENGTVQGDRATHVNTGVFGACCVAIWGSTDVFIYNVTAKDSYTDGFWILYNDAVAPYAESRNVHLINCTADNNYRNGASVIGCIGGSIVGGRYINSNGTAPQDGIDVEPNANNGSGGPSTVSNFVVQGVHAYGNSTTGIEVYGAGTVEYVDLIGNFCYDNGAQGIVYRSASNGSVDTNTVYDNAVNGISAYSVTNTAFNNNITTKNVQAGIIIQNPQNALTQDLVIDGNISNENGTGILVTGLTNQIANVVVSNNEVFANQGDGININYASNVRVDSNVIASNGLATDDTYSSIITANTTYTNITNNTCRHGGTANQVKYGINIGATSVGCYVLNNDVFSSGRTSSLNIAAADTVVYGPKQTNASAALEVVSTTLGFRPPTMTTTQKNAISNPAAGLIVFDTTLSKLCVYSGSTWQTITST